MCCASMTITRRDQNGVVLRYETDAPLNAKPVPIPDPENTANLIAGLSRKVLELKEDLEVARTKPDRAATNDRPILLRRISDIVAEKREPEWLIDDVLERNVLAVIAGARGTLKSFIALDWSMRMALDNHAGVILSGEGGGLDRRVAAWTNQHRGSLDISSLPLVALERPLNLNSIVVLETLRAAMAELPHAPAFVVIDTFSKFSAGIDENSNGEVAQYLSGLCMLRDEFRCTVILVAHSGHGNEKRPRGANALMSNPDAEYIVERAGMTVTVTRERFKDTPALPPLAYEAKVIDLGRLDKRGHPVTSLALVSADVPMPRAKGRGKHQDRIVVALKEWQRANPSACDISTIDLTDLFRAQGVKDRRRRREVLDSFVNAKILTHSVGGYLIHGEHL
jgi:AAA domain